MLGNHVMYCVSTKSSDIEGLLPSSVTWSRTNGAVLQSNSSYIILKPFSNDSHVIAQLQFIELQYSDAREYG